MSCAPSVDCIVIKGTASVPDHSNSLFCGLNDRFTLGLCPLQATRATTMSLYLYQNDQQAGPFTDEQIAQMIQSGLVAGTTLCWKEGMAGWKPLSTQLPTTNIPLPPAPPAAKSRLGLISLIIGCVALIGWVVLLVVAGIAQNNGSATKGFNIIIGLFFFLGLFVNCIAIVVAIIGAFKSKDKTLAIIGACMNVLQIVGLIGLMLLGLAARGGG